jgi:hypothetical protein
MKVAHHSMLPILSSVFSGGHVTIEGFTELAGPIPEEENQILNITSKGSRVLSYAKAEFTLY